MRLTRSVWFAAALAVGLTAGCHKKPKTTADKDHGTTEGAKPDDGTEKIGDKSQPVTPPLEKGDIHDGDGTGGPLKDVYFDFDRYDIRADQRPTLDGNSTWLHGNTAQNVLIEGHCDERGTEEYNLALGDKRANSTKDYLKTLGVSAGRMSTISYGKAYPVDPGHSEGAWTRNRRAHFTLVSPKAGATR